MHLGLNLFSPWLPASIENLWTLVSLPLVSLALSSGCASWNALQSHILITARQVIGPTQVSYHLVMPCSHRECHPGEAFSPFHPVLVMLHTKKQMCFSCSLFVVIFTAFLFWLTLTLNVRWELQPISSNMFSPVVRRLNMWVYVNQSDCHQHLEK